MSISARTTPDSTVPSSTDHGPGRRRVAIVALMLGVTAVAVLAARQFAPPRSALPFTERATVLPQPKPLPRLSLVDERGEPFDGSAFRSHWTYVFFGFTSCPDICPTTLAVLTQVRRELQGPPTNRQPRVLLVSVDPVRDDPAQLASYVSFFDPGFHAATGSDAALAQTAGAFGAAYARVEQPGGGYTMDHTASLFLVGPAGELVATSGPPHDPAALARDYRRITAANGG